jgi:2,3-bisphosphoglycerate-dependent phosphoglycerate mutase
MSRRVLWLIRHGRADFDTKEFAETPRGRQFDPPLDETGREQSEKLAKRLLAMDPQPAAVYCSPLRRARETVAPYVERSGADVQFDDDLVEVNTGEWESKTFEEILAADAEILRRILDHESIWHRAPGAETLASLRARVSRSIEGILRRHDDGDVVVICHGGVINAFIAPILGLEHEMFFLPENTSVNTVVIENGDRRVRFLNDVLHLTDPHLFEPVD